MITIDVANRQTYVPLVEKRLKDAVQMVLEDASIAEAQISLAVVDDPTIRELHRKYLEQDEPTDVLSFVYRHGDEGLEGEVIVSAETADLSAASFDWTPQEELLLYVIHGALHLVGYGDTTPDKQAEMRQKERAYLTRLGVAPHHGEVSDAGGR